VKFVTLTEVSTRRADLSKPTQYRVDAQSSGSVFKPRRIRMTPPSKSCNNGERQDDCSQRHRYRKPQPSQPGFFVISFFQWNPNRLLSMPR
jgi:hypothetical protein